MNNDITAAFILFIPMLVYILRLRRKIYYIILEMNLLNFSGIYLAYYKHTRIYHIYFHQ